MVSKVDEVLAGGEGPIVPEPTPKKEPICHVTGNGKEVLINVSVKSEKDGHEILEDSDGVDHSGHTQDHRPPCGIQKEPTNTPKPINTPVPEITPGKGIPTSTAQFTPNPQITQEFSKKPVDVSETGVQGEVYGWGTVAAAILVGAYIGAKKFLRDNR